MEEKPKRDFENFARKISRAPIGANLHWASGRYGNPEIRSVFGGRLELKEIYEIMEEGNIAALRELSAYYYRISGIYRNAILFLANLPMYQTLVTPIFDMVKKIPQDVTLKRFYESLLFVDNLEVPINFSRISIAVLLKGVYYGVLREDASGRTIQDLPETYCRHNYKDCNNLDIIEFNVSYFDTIRDEKLRIEALEAFHPLVRKWYLKWKAGKTDSPWVAITAAEGACCFQVADGTPFFLTAIPMIYQLEKAVGREATRDENELYKLLIQKMPIDNNGELVFQLEEVADIHASVASMLKGIDTVDVLTTFGDTSMESIQDSTAASQSADRLEKYANSVYQGLGLSKLYFNADTSSAMQYANAKDEAMMAMLTDQYAKWIEYQVNRRYAKANLTFDVTILPTTRINRKEIQSQLFQGAQYGYSKMAAGVATGIKQVNMVPIMIFENDYLHMSEKMMPLMSSYTSSGNDKLQKINGETGKTSSSSGDITDENGRPAKDAKDRSDKTQENIDGKG